MKVVLNLTPLGENLKTGIYRVTRHLVNGLAARMGPDASFHPISFAGGSVRYFERELEGYGSRLAMAGAGHALLPLSRALTSFIQESIANRSFHYRAARRVACVLIQRVDGICSRIEPSALRETSIYHSPYERIPRQVKDAAHVKRFTTIYDLIAITHPEYFTPETSEALRKIINNLDPDDYTLCISDATRRDLLKHSPCSPERSFVVPLAASSCFYPCPLRDDTLQILGRYGIFKPGYILSLCTFEIRKNLESVIQAFAKLHESGMIPEDTRLVLVGGKGWKTGNIQNALGSASAVRDLIIMPGFVPDEDLAAIYSSARVFAYMSFLEGFGLPPLEAMQCGTPVITSNTSSLPEVVGDAGVMLDPTDINGLCTAIARIYSDDNHHAALAVKSLERAKLFSWDLFVSQTIDAYRCALSESGVEQFSPQAITR